FSFDRASSRARMTLSRPRMQAPLAEQQAVNSAADVAQIRLVALLQLCDDASGIADFGEGLAHCGPVDVAVAEIDPLVAAFFALEIFEVDFHDAFAQGADPILGIAVQH